IDEAVVDDLEVLAIGEDALQVGYAAARLVIGEHHERRVRRARRDVVVAVQARHLLDQVLLDLEIEAVRGRRYRELAATARMLQLQALQQRLDLRVGEGYADDLRGALGAQAHRPPLGQAPERLADRARRAAADLDHELRGALERLDVAREIDASLEA